MELADLSYEEWTDLLDATSARASRFRELAMGQAYLRKSELLTYADRQQALYDRLLEEFRRRGITRPLRPVE